MTNQILFYSFKFRGFLSVSQLGSVPGSMESVVWGAMQQIVTTNNVLC